MLNKSFALHKGFIIKSYQNFIFLQHLYRLKAIGFKFTNQISVNLNPKTILPCDMGQLNDIITSCHLCDLSKTRTQSMIGYGNSHAKVMFIDSTVSEMQDKNDNYYVGKSGESLKKMIENVLLINIHDVYITHALKCMPHENSVASLTQYNSCRSYLLKQIELIKPEIIITLGEDAYLAFSQDNQKFNDIRGHVMDFNKYKLVPIYHPNFLLRNPSLKKIALNDLMLIKNLL